MKVIVASFPKCGTKTLKRCLSILGYSVYDVDENFTFLEAEWIDIMVNGPTVEKFKKMYKDVDAASDIPACHYWEYLVEAFPEAKIILTTRNSVEDWLRSWTAQLDAITFSIPWQLRSYLTPTGRRFRNFQRHKGRVVFDCPPQGFGRVMDQDPRVNKTKYQQHVHSILEKAPKERLLLMNLKDGWKPLCDFLGKEIPEDPFPHANKKAPVLSDEVAAMAFGKMAAELRIVKAFVCIFLAVVVFLIW